MPGESGLYFGIVNRRMHLDLKVYLEQWWEIKLERQGGLTAEGSKY